jgi:5-methyltetrahydrofolate--homocysteine methyltransferase
MEEHNAYALDFIRATAWIRQHLKGAHVSGGVSNLSFAFRGNNYLREAMHAVFLYHAIQAGMDFGIVNPSSKVIYDDIPAPLLQAIEDVVLNRRPDATERLAEEAARQAAQAPTGPQGAEKSGSGTPQADAQTLEERLQQALIKGDATTLPADLHEAMGRYGRAVSVIEGPLMDAMNEVGRRFGEGRMFLPQVVKAARTMKQAVELLMGEETPSWSPSLPPRAGQGCCWQR